MSQSDDTGGRNAIFLSPGEGRSDPMGRISAVFKADPEETGGAYSIAAWFAENPPGDA
jgi:hypothetical protein